MLWWDARSQLVIQSGFTVPTVCKHCFDDGWKSHILRISTKVMTCNILVPVVTCWPGWLMVTKHWDETLHFTCGTAQVKVSQLSSLGVEGIPQQLQVHGIISNPLSCPCSVNRIQSFLKKKERFFSRQTTQWQIMALVTKLESLKQVKWVKEKNEEQKEKRIHNVHWYSFISEWQSVTTLSFGRDLLCALLILRWMLERR